MGDFFKIKILQKTPNFNVFDKKLYEKLTFLKIFPINFVLIIKKITF